MELHPFDPDQFWEVDIEWKKPILYTRIIEEGCHHDDQANLYHILAKFPSGKFKSLYIGHTYQHCVSWRLCQKDHRYRYSEFVKEYPRHTFWVSCGIVDIEGGKITQKRIKDVETILIRTNDSDHSFNVANVYGHGVTGTYKIANYGYRCGCLPRILYLGFFYK